MCYFHFDSDVAMRVELLLGCAALALAVTSATVVSYLLMHPAF